MEPYKADGTVKQTKILFLTCAQCGDEYLHTVQVGLDHPIANFLCPACSNKQQLEEFKNNAKKHKETAG